MKSNNRHRFFLICAAPVLVCAVLVVGALRKQQRQLQADNALVAAVKSFDADAVDAALQRGASPNARDNTHTPPTFWQMLAYWLHHRAAPIPSGDPVLSLVLSPDTWFHYRGHQRVVPHDPRIVQALLQAGANPDAPGTNGSPPLAVACTGCPPEDVRLLLTYHARIEAKDKYGRTGLIYAACSNESVVVPLLLEYAADVNTSDKGGETPLMMATVMGRVPTAQRLLARHADVNAADRMGNTALWYAKRDKRVAMIRLLEQNGAKR